MEKMYLKNEFERLVNGHISLPTNGLVSELGDLCDSVSAINGSEVFYNQGMEGNCVSSMCHRDMDVILANLFMFRNLRQLIVDSRSSYTYMEHWPKSLEQVTLNRKADLSGLNHLTNLKRLGLRYDKADLAAIHPIAEQITELAFNSVKDETELGNFKNLEILTYGTQAKSMSCFASLTKLRRLFIERFDCGTLDGVEGCKSLEMLRIQSAESNPLRDISALSSLPNLKSFTVASGELMDISPLAEMSLEKLALHNIPLLDFSPIGEMKSLKELEIGNCMLEDLSVLEGAENLEVLNLYDNYVTDYTPLLKLPKLREVKGVYPSSLPKELRKKLGYEEE